MVTARQREALQVLARSVRAGQPITLREMSARMGSCLQRAFQYVKALRKLGLVTTPGHGQTRATVVTDAGYREIGFWCSTCERPAFELYAIPNVFTMRCMSCARASLRVDEVASLLT